MDRIKKEGIKVKCHKCNYMWYYFGKSNLKLSRATCPNCSSKITISHKGQLDLNKCVSCNKTFQKLAIHHFSYQHEIIIPVCERCHRLIHNDKNHKLYPIDKKEIKLEGGVSN